MLGQLLITLRNAQLWMSQQGTVSEMRPIPYTFCVNGCGCRVGTLDADATECGCDGPCCLGSEAGWFSADLDTLADAALYCIIAMLEITDDERPVGALLVDRARQLSRSCIAEKVADHKERARQQLSPVAQVMSGYPGQ